MALASVAVIWLGVAGAAYAQGGQEVISSAGPMTRIYLNDDLACQVQMAGDASPSFFGGTDPGACGTFMQVNADSQYGVPAELFGPTVPSGAAGLTDFTPDPLAPQTLTGNGTAASPYTVTTTADACDGPCSDGVLLATLTEYDTYVAGSDYYTTILTIQNQLSNALSGTLYHAGDCNLQGNDSGYGALAAGGAPECALSPNNSPSGRSLGFVPGNTRASAYYEGASGTAWSDITTAGTPYPDTIDTSIFEDNGLGLSWGYSLTGSGPGSTTTIQYTTLIAQAPANTASPTVSGTPAVGQTLTCSPGTWSPTGPITYAYQWLRDGNPVAGATNNSYTVAAGDRGHSLACQVTADNGAGAASRTSAADSVPATGVPTVLAQPPKVNGAQGAAFAASVNPDGSATTAHFEYGLDPKYGLTTASNLYTAQTADQAVGSGSSPQIVSSTVTGLVPNALYHVRVVASNAAGSVTGADQTFTTAAIPLPRAPVLGSQANFTPTSGVVYIKPPAGAHVSASAAKVIEHAKAMSTRGHGFIPLTQALQLPVGTQVDARDGTLKVTTATTAAKHGKRTQTQSGEFSLGLFEVLQGNRRSLKGLTILKLLDSGIFAGAPSYKTECGARKASAQTGQNGGLVVFRPRGLRRRALQTLLASEHGNYRTQGRYSAATVRGTVFNVTDRCDGTLTQVERGTVVVNDYGRHKNVTVHTGHSYLAKAS